MQQLTLRLGNKRFIVNRSLLRQWCELEDLRKKILDTAAGDGSLTGSRIIAYLAAVLGSEVNLLSYPWWEVSEAFLQVVVLNQPEKDFPILRIQSSKKTAITFDYDERSWYFWLHTFASAYGWDQDKIAILDLDDAIGLLQEILVSEYDQRSWDWSRSEVAYSYDKGSKTSKLKELPKPQWMNVTSKKKPDVPKVKILKSMIPVGNVIKWDQELKQ